MFTTEDIKREASLIAKKNGVKSISLFGSYARGEANEDSDLDFYIDKGDVDDLFKYFGLVNDLEDVFGCHVDVVTTDIEDKEFLNSIKKEGVLLYETAR